MNIDTLTPLRGHSKHRITTSLFAVLLFLSVSAASAEIYSSPQKIREVPDYQEVEVEIWSDRGDGARYCAGEPIEIFFRTNVDAWVAIYDFDTSGRITKLFPARRASNNFVRGGVVNRLPSSYGHHFEVEGPSGWETLKAVASRHRRALRNINWHDGDRHDGNRHGNRHDGDRHDGDWRDDDWHNGDWRDGDWRERGRDRHDRAPRYRPTASPASDRLTAVPNKIREVPDYPPVSPALALAETRHYVRDGYRCRIDRPRPSRPWWQRR